MHLQCFLHLDLLGGNSLEESFVNAAYGMIDYMTDRSLITIDPSQGIEIIATGRDLSGLLFYFLDEILYHSVSEPFLAIKLIELVEFKADEIYQIKAKCHGERFDRTRHSVGTEVKAITFSNMRIKDTHPFDIYVVVDI